MQVQIEIEKYRKNSSSRQWELPAWGHPISQGILPLFITFEGRLFPVGTAFTIGRGITFVISAFHNIREAWKHEERLAHLLFTPELPKSIDLRSAGISVLHHRPNDRSGMDITILPLENVAGAPPTDVVFGFPEFQANLNRIAELIDLIGEGRIPTDGSEERVGICKVNGTETFSVHPRAEKTMSGYIHDDFSGYQQGMKASHQEGTVFRFRRAN